MGFQKEKYLQLAQEIQDSHVTIVAVSKTKPIEDLKEAYDAGVRDFGENYVQELCEKQLALPQDIRWHFIGHLQSNKVKYIAPFVHLIHGVDSEKLLIEINKQGKKLNRKISCLLQIYIAKEETKFGMNEAELRSTLNILPELDYVNVCGLMGMASFSDNEQIVASEFSYLNDLFQNLNIELQSSHRKIIYLSTGMSGDYKIALQHGSNMIRIGSLLFGERKYHQ